MILCFQSFSGDWVHATGDLLQSPPARGPRPLLLGGLKLCGSHQRSKLAFYMCCHICYMSSHIYSSWLCRLRLLFIFLQISKCLNVLFWQSETETTWCGWKSREQPLQLSMLSRDGKWLLLPSYSILLKVLLVLNVK